MKLHLGCGEIYLKGYINVDFPSTKHSVQQKRVADVCKDILSLHYPPGSIEEIRLHHVFEHFSRPVACALVSVWYLWLKPGGILHIEVPDFFRTAIVILNPFSSDRMKDVAMRHLYGSHEANWAIHCAGYTMKSLSDFLKHYGLQIIKTRKNTGRGTYNIEIISQKSSIGFDLKTLEKLTEDYLRRFLINSSKSGSESRLLSVWMKNYKDQVRKSIKV